MDSPARSEAINEDRFRIGEARFRAGELEVEQHSAELRKELSLPNLVFTQVLSIVGLAWVGTAGKLGPPHLTFWLAAIALFYLPSAFVVIHLNNEMPLEGGLYQWAKLRFNAMIGFLVALNIWFYNINFVSQMGVLFANNLAYVLGPSSAWVADSKAVITIASIVITLLLVLVARIGLALGKWIHGLAGFMILFLFASMICFAVPRWVAGPATHPPLSLAIPAFTLLNLNILGKMGFGAMGGFDTVAIFAGECRGDNAAQTIRRSVWISTPMIASAFVLGTVCVLAFVQPGDIDLISPVTQVLNRGMQWAGIPGSASAIVPAMIMLTLIGQAVLSFNCTARLPLVAGWDHLLPSWFTRLHPKYKTPGGSILVIGATTLVLAVVTGLGAGNQETYQILQNSNGLAYGFAYIAMFAIPLLGRGEKTSWALRIAAVAGLAMTLLYMVMTVFPIVDVQSRTVFALKVSGILFVLNLAGTVFYWRRTSLRKRAFEEVRL